MNLKQENKQLRINKDFCLDEYWIIEKFNKKEHERFRKKFADIIAKFDTIYKLL